MTLQNFRHGSLAGGPIILQTGWPHDPAKNYARWPQPNASRRSPTALSPHASQHPERVVSARGLWAAYPPGMAGMCVRLWDVSAKRA